VVTYINNNLLKSSSFIINPPRSSNILSITIYIQDQLFQIGNIYNTPWNSSALTPEETFIFSTFQTLVIGDFNLHSPQDDPLRHFHHADICRSEPFFDHALDRGFSLLNTPGSHTYFPHSSSRRSSTLDLAFANCTLSKFYSRWNNNTPPTGSDHSSPCTRIYLMFSIPPYTTPD
jgi:hypothetical protein